MNITIMDYKVLLLLTLYILLPTNCVAKRKAKSVSTVIDAKWHLTPTVLEISEYLTEESENLFWEYVEYINSLQPALIDSASDKERYDRALGEAARLLSNPQLNLLKLSLSMHYNSPRVEMYHQIALDRGVKCPVAVDFGDKLVCHLDSLDETVNAYLQKDVSSRPQLDTFRLDHQFPGCRNDSLTVVLYGELGTPEFKQYHDKLKEYAVKKEINYIVRHFVKERQPRKVRLSGYGVELQMKSTEYKATDDAAVQANNTLDEEEEEDEVEGFNFQRLRELYPDQVPSLVKLKTALLESTNEMAPLKVWQFQDLSQQAAQRILDAPHEDQLRTLVHIAQNFPVQARSLVSVKVSAEFRKELKHNQDQFINSLSLGVSEAALYMNGLYFDVDLIDVGKLLDTVRHELRVMQGLFSIGITDESLQKLLSLDLSPSSKTEYGLDIRDSAVQWINDIEKDGKYTRWSFSLMDLLRPTFPGMLRNIRRNLYSLVIICNPAHAASIPLIKL
uniref:UDP-glucose:glycoprotein glucosyltransferase n=1 Tax=Cacopsylla melanoneura TaxID=428564 RepID=A0A8D8LP14_9HEMI